MNKHCSKCNDTTGTLHPHCLKYDKPIKIDADWRLTPVQECLAHQEMLDLRKQHDAEKCRKMLREQTS